MLHSQQRYEAAGRRRHGVRRVLWVVAILVVWLVVAIVAVRQYYYQNLRPVSDSQQTHYETIASGTAAAKIGDQLKADHLIRNSRVFEWYIDSKDLRTKLQAGTYALRPSMTTPQIVSVITEGKIASNSITILPGQPIDQVRGVFAKAGFSNASLDTAFNPATYPGAPALTDKPATANLEGFLYPDTFQKTDNTDPSDIVKQSLDEMSQHLTPDVRASFANEGLSVFQGVTLASIVEQEVSKPADRAQAAQVFLKRLHTNMSLGSDVTAFYGARLAGQPPTTSFDSAYNTLLHPGLPPGPISNVSDSSLQAVAHPAPTDWLYFVAGDDGTTHFSNTLQEHQALTQQYCKKLCSGAE